MKKLFILIIVLGVLIGCIDPIELEKDEEAKVLVVDGGINTLSGGHSIKLTRSAKYGGVKVGEIKYEIGARLFIRDEIGNTISLNEEGKGLYTTPSDFIAKIGSTYTLIIVTKDGKEYQSYPERVVEVAEIDTAFFQYKEIQKASDVNEPDVVSGVDIIVGFQDKADETNYYKWETSGTYRIVTHPELFKPTGSQAVVPKECCELCFKSEENQIISISSDRFYDGNKYEKNVVFIEDDGFRFYEKYVIDITQISLSKDAYQFYELLENQLSISGDIFDPPPATIRGNILCITDPSENVVGYFNASDVRKTTLHIYGSSLPNVKAPPLVPDDCREVPGASVAQPDFW